jgi:hypothetical protein
MSDKAQATAVVAFIFIGLSWIQSGESPASLLARLVLHLRASYVWTFRELLPALRTATGRYPESIQEVLRWR